MDLCIKLEQIPSRRSWNIYKLSINIWLQWPCPLTCDLQNPIRSSLSPSGPLYQIWRNSLKAFLRYRIHRIGGPSDLWPPKSNQVILESKWTFIPNLKNLPQGISEILNSQTWPRQMWHHSDLDLWPMTTKIYIFSLLNSLRVGWKSLLVTQAEMFTCCD